MSDRESVVVFGSGSISSRLDRGVIIFDETETAAVRACFLSKQTHVVLFSPRAKTRDCVSRDPESKSLFSLYVRARGNRGAVMTFVGQADVTTIYLGRPRLVAQLARREVKRIINPPAY